MIFLKFDRLLAVFLALDVNSEGFLRELQNLSCVSSILVSHYTNWFGFAQFSGFIFAPIVGVVMDWKPKDKRDQKTDLGFVVGFFLTSFTAFIFNILVLVPDLSVQVLACCMREWSDL